MVHIKKKKKSLKLAAGNRNSTETDVSAIHSSLISTTEKSGGGWVQAIADPVLFAVFLHPGFILKNFLPVEGRWLPECQQKSQGSLLFATLSHVPLPNQSQAWVM